MKRSSRQSRRAFLDDVAKGALAAGAGAAILPDIAAAHTLPSAQPHDAVAAAAKPDESWLRDLKGAASQIFSVGSHNNGRPLIQTRNYMRHFREDYGLGYPKAIAIVGLWANAVPLALKSNMWEKYKLGAAIDLTDTKSRAHAIRNVLAAAEPGELNLPVPGATLPASASIQALQQDRVRFILCNNSLANWAMRLSQSSKIELERVSADLGANVLPGITVVPAMVIAIHRAQASGATYMHLS